MMGWNDLLVAEAYYEEMERDAERYRLRKATVKPPPKEERLTLFEQLRLWLERFGQTPLARDTVW